MMAGTLRKRAHVPRVKRERTSLSSGGRVLVEIQMDERQANRGRGTKAKGNERGMFALVVGVRWTVCISSRRMMRRRELAVVGGER